MSRSTRLLDLLQLLRQYRQPVSAHALADKLSVSVRTIYRDIETLRQQGAEIQGEAGLGYVLRDGFVLPPLMFTIEELEALLLGSRWVQNHGDDKLVKSATQALAKINSVIPKNHKHLIDSHALFAPSFVYNRSQNFRDSNVPEIVRQAIRLEKVIHINYEDAKVKVSNRCIHPFGVAFFDEVQVIMAWCCLREDFRHFRIDRIQSLKLTEQTYTPNKQTLIKKWQEKEGIEHSILQIF